MDGTCDCNCGRYDPDCAGPTGKPYNFANELKALNNTDFLVVDRVRIQCPSGIQGSAFAHLKGSRSCGSL